MARLRDTAARPTSRSKPRSATSSTGERSAFGESKKDKRQIKHSAFVSKIAKDNTKKTRRRRPNKKLVATLDSLADALPDVDVGDGPADPNSQVNIVRHKTVKTRPGAMKRKEKLERSERDRFTKNLAEMTKPELATAGTTESVSTDSTASRWQALRTFISTTLDRLPEQSAPTS